MRKSSLCLLLSVLLVSCEVQNNSETGNQSVLRVAAESDPQTLDPRLSRTLLDTTVMHTLYEGLMRIDEEGEPENALAEKISVSPDLKTYTFLLKKTFWSDGSPLTSMDFVETWKSILDPSFPSPNASQLYVIKGAKDAKEGKGSSEKIGLHYQTDLTFTVELETPTPYFEKLLSSHFFFPQHQKVRNAKQTSVSPGGYMYNGPFLLGEWKHHDKLTFLKNQKYWDAPNTKVEQIEFIVADETLALNFYHQDKLDWAGSPLSSLPQDAIQNLRKEEKLKLAEACGTYWFRFNSGSDPFVNEEMRKAFCLAINRGDIIEYVTQGNQVAALGILPPPLSLKSEGFFKDNDLSAAKSHFANALNQLKLNSDDLPKITLLYGNNERHHKVAQAVQQQWLAALGINVELQACEAKISYDKLAKGNYQIMLGSWFADISDPINFLNVFYASDLTYAQLIDESNTQTNAGERSHRLLLAETHLMNTMRVAPLFFNTFNYLKKENVKGVYFSPLGYLDFKNAEIHE